MKHNTRQINSGMVYLSIRKDKVITMKEDILSTQDKVAILVALVLLFITIATL